MSASQLDSPVGCAKTDAFAEQLRTFTEFDKETRIEDFPDPTVQLPVYINEFWTAKQRAASSLHEISYRACFKPQLPRFFIERLSSPDDIVYDPFMGRGTTPLEAAILGRAPAGCDINPLSKRLLAPRLDPPAPEAVAKRLAEIDLSKKAADLPEDLLTFYHPETLQEICALREYFIAREVSGEIDPADAWIRMVATNRLTGHSPGFFSVYSLPPNQAVTVESQRKINAKRNQVPPRREVIPIILKKSRTLLNKAGVLPSFSDAQLLTGACDSTPALAENSVALVVTSPPFLDVVDYQTDNWLRCWFNGIDASSIPIWQLKKAEDWTAAMTRVFEELRRVLIPGGHIAFEVGEIKKGKLLMETLVVPAAKAAGLIPRLVLVNDQIFTKTANVWGVSNLTKGTNTNRIILLQKPR
ncbi:site-specific DNA-methyltransferase [Verrucomicrobiales bacterium]|nr:site-specific DNA-methyltransferase [Verrucomicrobiales bacterium]